MQRGFIAVLIASICFLGETTTAAMGTVGSSDNERIAEAIDLVGAAPGAGAKLAEAATKPGEQAPAEKQSKLPPALNLTTPGAFAIVPDGDPKVPSQQTLTVADPPGGPARHGLSALKIDYRFSPGWKFARVAPRTAAAKAIAGKPKALDLWVYGDGSGEMVRLRYTDATGQTFQETGASLTWKGWKEVSFPMNAASSHDHWGGANDDQVHYPIVWNTLFLIDNAKRQAAQGTVYIAGPVLVY